MRLYSARILFLVTVLLIINTLAICSCNVCRQDGNDSSNPEVILPQGKLRGVNIVTNHKRVIHGFLGIPFAQPPIGNLRFRAPLAAAAWTGTLNATKDASMCPQVVRGAVTGEEDCLYLNVYTPKLPSSDSTPMSVMVWIHGGAFSSGKGDSTEASPRYILDKNVILVAPNFRIGPLGFLSTGDEASPGNYGLKDQVLALKWVRNNIEYFGGDPSRVTLFGRSSGAASVNLLALSDSTIGLFHQYIKISGSALSPRGYVPRHILARYSYSLGKNLGCSNTSSNALVECLRRKDALDIANTTSLFRKWNNFPDIVWRPTDEPDVHGAFITDSPANLYAAGKIRDLPCISGVVRDEGLFYTRRFYENPDIFDDFLDKLDDVLPYMLLYQDHEDVSTRTAALKAFYLNDLSANREVLLANLTKLIGDVYYTYPTYSAHEKQFALGKSSQYFYSFDYLRTFKYKKDDVVPNGIQHTDDKPFLFPIEEILCKLGLINCEMSGSDFEMVDIMADLWTSFAINGEPILHSDDAVIWEPYSTEDNYLTIGNGPDLALEMKYSFLRERMQFWNELQTSHDSEKSHAQLSKTGVSPTADDN